MTVYPRPPYDGLGYYLTKRKVFCKNTLTKKLLFSIIVDVHRGLVQSVEHRSPKPSVVGSSPPAPAKKRTKRSLRSFFIQSEGLVYHRRTKCGVYHQGRLPPLYLITRQRASYLRLDDIQHFVLMIYRNKLRMIYKTSF